MATDPKKTLASIVNASGFAFQLAIEAQLRAEGSHGWDVISRERPWKHDRTDEFGFADLILQKGAVTWIVECKRTRGGAWVFLVPDGDAGEKERVRALWHAGLDGKQTSGVDEFMMTPRSLESAFCVVRGSGEGDRGLLERIGSRLIRGVDCVANEEMGILSKADGESWGFSVPVVVTTAKLHVCKFDPTIVSLADGIVNDAEYETTPWIRFRKAFLPDDLPGGTSVDFREVGLLKERTILVVNAEHLVPLLKKAGAHVADHQDMWPWSAGIAALRERRDG